MNTPAVPATTRRPRAGRRARTGTRAAGGGASGCDACGGGRRCRAVVHAVVAGAARSCGDGSRRPPCRLESRTCRTTCAASRPRFASSSGAARRSGCSRSSQSSGSRAALNPGRGEWDSARLHDLGAAIDVWARWDSDWFLRIAQNGYSWPSSTPAFFPLYPFLVAALGWAFAGHAVLAGVVVSLVAGCRCVRPALSAHVRPARGGRSAANGALPRPRPDLALLRRRLQRVALPAPRRGDVPRRRARAVLAGRGRGRSRAPDPLGRRRSPARRSSCSPGGRRTGAARSPVSPSRRRCSRSTPSCSPSGSATRSRSSTRRRSSGSGTSRRRARSEASWRRCQHHEAPRSRRRRRLDRPRRRRLAPDRRRVRALHPRQRRDSADVRLGQGAALVDAALRRRRLPGVHGARDPGAEPPGDALHRRLFSGHGSPWMWSDGRCGTGWPDRSRGAGTDLRVRRPAASSPGARSSGSSRSSRTERGSLVPRRPTTCSTSGRPSSAR